MRLFNSFNTARQKLFNVALALESKTGMYFCCYFLRYKITRNDFEKNYRPDHQGSPQFKLLIQFNSKEGETFLTSKMMTAYEAIQEAETKSYREINALFVKSTKAHNARLELQKLQDNEAYQAKCIMESEQRELRQLPFPIGQPQTHESAERVGIKIPTPLPLFDNSPNFNRLACWADSQLTPKLRQIAHKIVTHINYINFDAFLKRLKQMTLEFNQSIGDTPYVLLIGTYADKRHQGTSEQWVSGLALEYCELKQPAGITTIEEIKSYLTAHPDIHHVLLIDDAIYSGAQKGDVLNDIFRRLKGMDFELLLGVPYISRIGVYIINDLMKKSSQLKVLSHQVIPVLEDALSIEEQNYLRKLGVNMRLTLTYFSHRFPDWLSTLQVIYTGGTLISKWHYEFIRQILRKKDAKEQDWISYNQEQDYQGTNIPFTLSPYRKLPSNPDDRIKFEDTVKKGRLGKRNNQPILDTMDELVTFRLRDHGLFKPFTIRVIDDKPYKSPGLPLNEQNELDEEILRVPL